MTSTSTRTPAVRPFLTHVGVNVYDIDTMEAFYRNVIGLVVTDRGKAPTFGVDLVFMSVSPHEHHQFALASGRDPGSPVSTVNQISFHLQSLDELRTMHRRLRAHGVTHVRPLNHGLAWSLYFTDPEGNMVELYTESPWYISQPHGEPFDPELPTEQIVADTLAMCRTDPKFMPIERFQEQVRRAVDGRDGQVEATSTEH